MLEGDTEEARETATSDSAVLLSLEDHSRAQRPINAQPSPPPLCYHHKFSVFCASCLGARRGCTFYSAGGAVVVASSAFFVCTTSNYN